MCSLIALLADPDREAVARKLIQNHEAVLRDVCNAAPTTQLQLVRVPSSSAEYADQALREVARRLVGKGAKTCPREYLEVSLPEQVKAWQATATYLSARIQSNEMERPGRQPDMTQGSADQFRTALQEIWWTAYELLRRIDQSRASPHHHMH